MFQSAPSTSCQSAVCQPTVSTHGPCRHEAKCPPATAPDHVAARVVASHPEQGWSLLCNGVVVFDDQGEILPDGTCLAPYRNTAGRPLCAA
ncbi:MAG TPA: DUF5999 family protein [Thermoleophilia bacterium]|nr:DUF5999 family protein [Thermoleophilia bacterium]